MMRLSSHEGGGAWPGGVGGLPPGPLGGSTSMFGDGSYSGNVMQGGSVLQPVAGVLTITAAATVVPDLVTFSCVVLCDTLILDGASASLTPSTNAKGLIVYAKTGLQLINGAKLNIDTLGKAGNFGNLTAWGLTPASLQGRLKQAALDAYVALGEGAAGGAGNTATSPGGAASAMQTGGGGSGPSTGGVTAGKGGKGGPCCGGASGATTYGAGDAGDYGGAGGNSSGNGARGVGDPGGSFGGGDGGALPIPPGAGGGLLMLFTPSLSIASGCIVSSDGAAGGAGSAYGSGGGGGGCVVIVTRSGGYSNAGTVRANGGGITGISYNAAPGGAGSVNTFTV